MPSFLFLHSPVSSLNPKPLLHLLIRLPRPPLNIIPPIRPPRLPHLLPRQRPRHLLHIHQLFYPHDLACHRGSDGLVHGRHAFSQAEGFQNALGFCGHADAAAREGYAEVGLCGHCGG